MPGDVVGCDRSGTPFWQSPYGGECAQCWQGIASSGQTSEEFKTTSGRHSPTIGVRCSHPPIEAVNSIPFSILNSTPLSVLQCDTKIKRDSTRRMMDHQRRENGSK